MTARNATRPSLIRNASWAIGWDGGGGHAYRSNVDVRLRDGQIVAIAPGGTLETTAADVLLEARGLMLMPGLVDIHSHPSTEPGFRGVREDHGVPEQQMTGLMERLQAFRMPDDGRQGAATLAYAEMLRAGTTTACDVTQPFDGWLETMARSGMRF